MFSVIGGRDTSASSFNFSTHGGTGAVRTRRDNTCSPQYSIRLRCLPVSEPPRHGAGWSENIVLVEAAVTSTWHVIVPVKHSARAKSRLRPPAGVPRRDLALAIALDTLDTVLAVVPARQVFVVTEDPEIRLQLRGSGVVLVDDPGRGLNAAVGAGISAVCTHAPHTPAAVLLGDLPALNAVELASGLAACAAAEAAVVPDHEGSGTVLLTHHDAARLVPRFGTGSAARHARSATTLHLELPRLRTDVDNDASLDLVRQLGVGPWTSRLLELPS
jgi:2-phospho-L-lactate/phosphoenolpyruvate guanylyltransferase